MFSDSFESQGYVPALRFFDWQEGDHTGEKKFVWTPHVPAPGMDRCGQLVARLSETQDEDLEGWEDEMFNFEVSCRMEVRLSSWPGGEPKAASTTGARASGTSSCCSQDFGQARTRSTRTCS